MAKPILVPIGQVKSNPKNPRIIKDDKFKKLVKSIKEFPEMLQLRPIVVNKDNISLGGNQRLKACKSAGLKKVWIYDASHLSAEQQREFIIKDNLSYGEWDWEVIHKEWDTEKLKDWGMDIKAFSGEETSDDNFVMPEKIITDIKEGDLFEIGPHRLLCGKAEDPDNIKRLMNGKTAELVFTDPPYRMEAEGGSRQPIGRAAARVGNAIKELCDFDPIDYLNALPSLFAKNYMNAYVFCNKDLVPDYLNWAIHAGFNFNILFWKKPNAIPLGGQHRPDVEYLIFFRKSATWNNGLEGVNYSKCLEYGRENSTPHPTMKPVELVANEIKISSMPGSIVVDSFGGSGTTMLVCEQLNRKCYMTEAEPKYCQVIVSRLTKQSPNIAIKKNGKPYKVNK